MKGKKIAIVGSGISGLTCGYYLSKENSITLYESEDYIGGHTHTVSVEKDGEKSDIDTGFIVFNDKTYPHFIELMNSLNVSYHPTEMSFSVRNDAIDLEYNGHTFQSLFAQRSNIFRLSFWKMLKEIVHFNKDVRVSAEKAPSLTIGDYLENNSYSVLFRENYLLPMISAIWSMGLQSCLELPLLFFVRFFENHGLLNVVDRPQWYTIKGGSSSYIEPLIKNFKENIELSTPVKKVERVTGGVAVQSDKHTMVYDEVIFSCHADQALALLHEPSQNEETVLDRINFSKNSVILHTDTSHLPSRKGAWASWNYRMVDAAKEQTILTYNMNILQGLLKKHTYLVTLNQDIAEEHILGSYNYEHPIFTKGTLKSQDQWSSISGVDRVHFCGAYWFNGFHEDGVRSGLRVTQMIEGKK